MYKYRHIAMQKKLGSGVLKYGIILVYVLSLTLLFDLVFAASAHAYIDPNTGGFFFQSVAPFIYGILGVIVVFWKRIIRYVKGLISRLTNKDNPPQDE